MTFVHYLSRSLQHYRFAYLGVLAGAVLGATVLLGALFAGDSVNVSLRRISENRIGRTTHLVSGGDRFFRQALAGDLATAANVRTAPLLLARGTATHPGNRAAANQVQLIGVTEAFWKFAPGPDTAAPNLTGSSVAINVTLARRLNAAVGDTLVVRLQKPGILAGNAPVAGAEATLASIRCTIAALVDEASFGRFSLEATQVPSPSVFLPIALLQENLAQPERANVLLIEATNPVGPALAAGPTRDERDHRDGPPTSGDPTAILSSALATSLRLADYGLSLKWLERAAVFELTSDRIFLDPELAEATTRAQPTAQPVVSYLVNEFRVRNRTTPYSIATGTTHEAAPFLPADLGPREVVLNDWLATDLQAAAGDEVQLTYFQTGAAGTLVEQSTAFRVRAIVPLQGLAADRAWMPAFPGITDVSNQSDWDPGLPLDLAKIRSQDETYWDEHRGAPKAFLSAAAGREIWATRWGNLTALRVAMDRARETELTASLLGALRPEMNQLLLRNLRASAQDAAKSAVDFGGLFIGMSFFLIVAALGLVAMLFQLSLLQRNREDALLGAVGLPAQKLLRWRLAEGVVILVLGCLAGLPLAVLYTRGILRFLETIWAGQTGEATFAFAAQPASIAIGAGVFLVFSVAAIWLAVRKQTRRALSIRLAAHTEETAPPARVRRNSLLASVAALAIAVGAIAASDHGLPAQGAFYLAGFALLAAGLASCRAWLARAETPGRGAALDASYLGALNLKTRRTRSLTVVGLIATAVFMVLSVASFRKNVGADWLKRGSGTGGFAFWIETTAALNAARDGRANGFEPFERQAVDLGEIVPFRAGTGDNVNCFNLNTTSQPKLLAVDAAKLAAREAFRPNVPLHSGNDSAWNALRVNAPGPIPALVDETTMMWALKRKIGDVLTYTDENGRAFEVQIVGTLRDSLFQGYLLVDETAFLEKFPSNPGYSVFLIDAKKPGDLEPLRKQLETALTDAGGRVDLTRDVLASFHQIENTYIAIFNVLGSLGVVLGSLGLAIVVARNLRERRGEFAVLSAIGIPRAVLARVVFAEFGRLVLWGIGIGALASAIAVWPSLTALPAAPTIGLVVTMLAGILALNLAWGWAIFRWSMKDLRPSVALAAG